MRYLKKFTLFLEAGLDILPTDAPDIKASKQKMELVTKQLADFKTKKSQIDTLYKATKDNKQIEADLVKILGVDVKSRNPFLVDYVTISKMIASVEKMKSENSLDKIRLDDFQQDLKTTTDQAIKKSISDKITNVNKRMSDRVTNITKTQNDFNVADKLHKEKMLQIEKDIQNNISKISNVT